MGENFPSREPRDVQGADGQLGRTASLARQAFLDSVTADLQAIEYASRSTQQTKLAVVGNVEVWCPRFPDTTLTLSLGHYAAGELTPPSHGFLFIH